MAADLIFWLLFPTVVGAGAGTLVWMLMNARIEVLKSRYRAAVAEMENGAELRGAALETAAREAREAGRREALENLISGLRVEQQRFTRRRRSLLGDHSRVIVRERVLLGDLPISGWMEYELPDRDPEPETAPVTRQLVVASARLSENGNRARIDAAG